MVKDFDKARAARKLAQEHDKSWFGVVGQTVPNLFEYMYKRGAILSTDTIDYRTLLSEAKM